MTDCNRIQRGLRATRQECVSQRLQSLRHYVQQIITIDSMRRFPTGVAAPTRTAPDKTAGKPPSACTAVTPGGHTMESSAAACSVRTTAHASPYHALTMRMIPQFFVFCPCWPLPLTFAPKFELGRDFCKVHLTAKFYHPAFNRSEVIVLTNKLANKQTPLITSTSLRYATPVGKYTPWAINKEPTYFSL